MITEIFQGTPEELKARLDQIISNPNTLDMVIPLASKSYYLIVYT